VVIVLVCQVIARTVSLHRQRSFFCTRSDKKVMSEEENFFALFAGPKRAKRPLSDPYVPPKPFQPHPNPVEITRNDLLPRAPASPPRSMADVPITVVDESDDDDDTLLLVKKKTEQSAPRLAAAQKPCTPLDTLPWNAGARGRRLVMCALQRALHTHLKTHPAALDAFTPFMTPKSRLEVLNSPTDVVFASIVAPTVIESATGEGFQLRSYQRDGVQYMLDNLARGLSTILADDMGLGKTAQVAAFLNIVRRNLGASGPHVIICPVSTAGGWARELARWAPLLRVIRYHGRDRSQLQHIVSAVFIVSPATFLKDKQFFTKRVWQLCILDEAHSIKGTSTLSSLVARIDAVMRIAITGTPVSISPLEIWRLMRFLYPTFGRRLAAPRTDDYDEDSGEDDVAPLAQLSLATRCSAVLAQVMLRRTKDSLNLGLPPRVDKPVDFVEMTELQRDLYSLMMGKASIETDGLASALMNLRRVCGHPWLFRLHLFREELPSSITSGFGLHRLRQAAVPVDEDTIVQCSAKMRRADELLAQHRRNGDRVLIFSNFTAQLDLLEGLCALRAYSCERLDGTLLRSERELLMARFNHPESKLFCLLISTTAGGVGITLTGANVVIIYDAHFNPQMDRQAADRAHRLGQTRTVTVHRLCVAGTIDERIMRRAAARAEVGDGIVDGNHQSEYGGLQRELLEYIHDTSQRPPPVANEGAALASLAAITTLPKVYVDFTATAGEIAAARVDGACFSCREDAGAMLECGGCRQHYHASCCEAPSAGRAHQWRCSRHRCSECGSQAVDDVLFMCTCCPASYCIECLDPAYLDLRGSRDGLQLPHLTHTDPSRLVPARRGVMYMTCGDCGGIGRAASPGSTVDSSSTFTLSDDDSIPLIDDE
jgi:superfamily II DNA or RNA helicase